MDEQSITRSVGHRGMNLAYTAGLFDGEGSLVLQRSATGSTSGVPTYSLLAQIVNLCGVPLLACQTEWGGSITERPNSVVAWRVCGTELDKFIVDIFPYTVVKRHLIILASKYRHACPSKPGGSGRSPQQVAEQEEYYQLFRRAQKRWHPR